MGWFDSDGSRERAKDEKNKEKLVKIRERQAREREALMRHAKPASEGIVMAQQAVGSNPNKSERQKAQRELEKKYGARKAAKMIEDEMVKAGAAPKGVRRWIG